jgi:hypothetical protein
MDACKKMVKVGVWAQVEDHLALLNASGSTQARVLEALHGSPYSKLSITFILFVQGIDL